MRTPSSRCPCAKVWYGSAGIRPALNAVSGSFWIVACDHRQYARRVLHGAADRTDARIDAGADHAVAADQFLGRREPDDVRGARRDPDRRARSPRQSSMSPGWPTRPLRCRRSTRQASVRCRTDCTPTPPNELRGCGLPALALARMMAPASRRRLMNVASCGGRSLANSTSALAVVRMSNVSYQSLIEITTP